MKFSAKFEYALLALLHLKCEPDDVPVSGRALSEKLNLPYRFLEQILADLKKGGIVQSVRGYQGGYRLNRAPEDISVFDVYEVTEGRLEPWDCAQNGADDRCGAGDHNRCVISHFYADFKETLRQLMVGYTLERLCQRAGELKGRSPNAEVAAVSIFGELLKKETK
jgi:Rrf2 family protein